MNIQIVNPLEYADWDSILLQNNNHSFFHTMAWANVLMKSYGFKPTYFVILDKGFLALLVPIMEIHTCLTGKRAVSLPFTDRCVPFFSQMNILPRVVQHIIDYGINAGWRHIEWRDSAYFAEAIRPSETLYTHDLCLLRSESDIYSGFADGNCRNINMAMRKGVTVRIDNSLDSVKTFYRLHCATRKRHGLPPQPFKFFRNVYDEIFCRNRAIVVSAYYSNRAIASAMFFHFGQSAIYKYGASYKEYWSLRPNNLIMWEAIRSFRERGFETLSFGKTAPEHQGLLRYKRLWGATESTFGYYAYALKNGAFSSSFNRKDELYKILFKRLPAGFLRFLGRIFYRHVG